MLTCTEKSPAYRECVAKSFVQLFILILRQSLRLEKMTNLFVRLMPRRYAPAPSACATNTTPLPRPALSRFPQEVTFGERFCEFYSLHRVCGRRLPCMCDKKRRRTGFTPASSSDLSALMALND